ncbi:LPO_1073/Vpar_1526 family protein [Microbacterium sp. Au-Mic1]|uniref:LPO_1073/Vpar_1526 family protein n=1 Tax=Microbacterium sp. Au-Mic1 TaxID=2906457 RepID=UPI0035A848DE
MLTGKRDQAQEGGDNSTNYQAGKDIHVHGLTIDEARVVALDVFRSNAIELAGVAQALAVARAERLTDEFLAKLEREIPARVGQLADPDVQSVVFQAQKEIARSGEEDLRTALVDLLAARVGEEERNLRALALNEAIASAPKLTEEQRRAVAWVFYLKYSRALDVGTPDAFYSRLTRESSALGVDVPKGQADYQHIEYVGAGSLSIATTSFGKGIMSGVEGLFTNGFAETDIDPALLEELRTHNFVTPALRDANRLQLALLGDEDLENRGAELGLAARLPELRNVVSLGRMSESDVSDEVVAKVPGIAALRDAWDDNQTGLQSMKLTSVGLALGHAYWTRLTGADAPLSIWLP